MSEKKYLDMQLGFQERAADLVDKMTLEEKVSQMLHYAPAIERLGVPKYNWWNEALHGVARAGVATVFPQAIGMAATFDKNLINAAAQIISDEARAKHHEFIRQGDREIYKGLTVWSPNINIFRDPRWGRGHETYGEDPYLTGELGVAFIKGLQGDDPKYLKVAACAKHFAVHSGPENLRHSFDAVVSMKDLHETYLPAFEKAVKKGHVESIMGAYNRVNGEPSCGSEYLLQKTLREAWGFEGHVVSDCWAICDFHLYHKVTKTPQESAAMAVKNGSDLNCGKTYASLLSAVDQGLIVEADIDKSCRRLFETRMKLGMFDQEDNNKYAHIPYLVNDHPDHHQLAIEVAERSMVLLSNKKDVLPLNIDKVPIIAVIGPNADDGEMLLGNYHGTPSRTVTPLAAIQDYVKDEARVLYAKGCEVFKDKTEVLAESKDRISEAVSAAKASDIAIVCVGLNSKYEGEQGDEGNADAAGDKKDLKLPGNQNELLEAVINTGVDTIVLCFSGSPMDLTWVDQHASAVIQCWYPGAEGSLALPKLLFGDIDFSGRTPVTWVKKSEDLPDFLDYSMKNRTYRYIQKDPLYPFGYGLSYNNYRYEGLRLSRQTLNAGEDLTLWVNVRNLSDRSGCEIVQVYLKDMEASVDVPNCSLVGFESVDLKGNEGMEIEFTVDSSQMAIVDEIGQRIIEPGRFEISIGGHGPDPRSEQLSGVKVLKAWFVVES